AHAMTPAISATENAIRRNSRTSSRSPMRTASAQRNTAPRYAEVAIARTPTRIPVQLNHDENWSPAAFPTGTRWAAIAPTTVPRANGVRIDESENAVSTTRCSFRSAVPARSAYVVPRKMIPIPAMNSGTARVEAIDPNAVGYPVQTTTRTKMSQTGFAAQTG